jgi:hypothetical protein
MYEYQINMFMYVYIGSLDVLSCATLMQLALFDLPESVNAAIVLFSLLELVNACQSFALQVLLSGSYVYVHNCIHKHMYI